MSYSQSSPSSYSHQPMQNWGNAPPPPPKSSLAWLWILLGVFGGGLLLVVVLCGGLIWYVASPPPVNDAVANQPFVMSDVAVTEFPPLGAAQQRFPGVDFYEVTLPDTDGDYSPPGNGGRLWVYVPQGEAPVASRPCILIAPAGSTLMEGMA